MFILKIRNLEIQTILGVYDWEKNAKRPVVLNIEMQISDNRSGDSDNINDTIDYAIIEQKVIERVANGRYQLIEKLATDIGACVLALDKRIVRVLVEADKPGALKQASSVAVQVSLP